MRGICVRDDFVHCCEVLTNLRGLGGQSPGQILDALAAVVPYVEQFDRGLLADCDGGRGANQIDGNRVGRIGLFDDREGDLRECARAVDLLDGVCNYC